MTENNLADIDFENITDELEKEDKNRENRIKRLNIYNQPNQQDHIFLEKENRELGMKTPQHGDKYIMVRLGRVGDNGG